jgi:hypothetical protein
MKTHKLFWGLILIGSGLLLLLRAFGIGEQYTLFRSLASVILLAIAGVNLPRFRFFMILVPLSIIAYLWRVQLGMADMKLIWLLAASVVLSIGLSVIIPKSRPRLFISKNYEAPNRKWHSTEEILNEDEFVTVEANFGEFTKYIHASNLKRVRLNCNASSMKIYFDQCQISPEGLEIVLNTNFSGVILHVPRSWTIDNQLAVTAGAVNGPLQPGATGGPNVKLTGRVNFAEVKIVTV